MIQELKNRLLKFGVFPWLGAGAAVVIIVFGLVAFANAQKLAPSTGSDSNQLGLGSSASATASSSATASATPSPSAAAAAHASATAAPASHGVLVDKSATIGHPTWESPTFNAPSTWTISYTYDCGGNGGHFNVAVFGPTMQFSPVDQHVDKGSGTVTVHQGGNNVYIATDTTPECSWHVTARG